MQLKAKLPGKVKDYIKKSNQMDNPNLILEKIELVHLLEANIKDSQLQFV